MMPPMKRLAQWQRPAELAAEEDPNTDIGQVVNDTLNDFSVGIGNDGNDTILGGDGVDDIDSGDGETL